MWRSPDAGQRPRTAVAAACRPGGAHAAAQASGTAAGPTVAAVPRQRPCPVDVQTASTFEPLPRGCLVDAICTSTQRPLSSVAHRYSQRDSTASVTAHTVAHRTDAALPQAQSTHEATIRSTPTNRRPVIACRRAWITGRLCDCGTGAQLVLSGDPLTASRTDDPVASPSAPDRATCGRFFPPHCPGARASAPSDRGCR